MIECGECDARFERDADFALHNHREHGADLEFKCFGCLEVLGSEKELVRERSILIGPTDRQKRSLKDNLLSSTFVYVMCTVL